MRRAVFHYKGRLHRIFQHSPRKLCWLPGFFIDIISNGIRIFHWSSFGTDKRMTPLKSFGVIACLTFCLNSSGAELEDFAKCTEFGNETERLACFERTTQLLKRQQEATTAEEAMVEPISRKTPASDDHSEKPAETSAASLPYREQDENITPTLAQPQPAASSDFGKRGQVGSFSLTTVIKDVRESKTRRNIHILTLGNGQVWQETQYGRGTTYRINDRITIKPGRFGTFLIINHRTEFSNHVRRID